MIFVQVIDKVSGEISCVFRSVVVVFFVEMIEKAPSTIVMFFMVALWVAIFATMEVAATAAGAIMRLIPIPIVVILVAVGITSVFVMKSLEEVARMLAIVAVAVTVVMVMVVLILVVVMIVLVPIVGTFIDQSHFFLVVAVVLVVATVLFIVSLLFFSFFSMRPSW